MTRARAWQLLVCVLVACMITLNLRILLSFPNVAPNPDDCNHEDFARLSGGTASVSGLNISEALLQWDQYSFDQDKAKVLGYFRKERGFLTIGVPSIKRVNGPSYLMQTLASIVKETMPKEKTEVVVVVLLADFDADYNKQVVKQITEQYMDYINMGFIQIIQAPRSFYPELSNLKRNFKDKPKRVTWRSKQVLDFSFMFLYSKNLSNYYIQLEDDVIAAPKFLNGIYTFIKAQKKPWAILDFSELGFIGKLFKSSDLVKVARYMMTFFDEQPIDWLIRYLRMSMAQSKLILRKPTLFQHIGKTSSFDISKPNNLKDKYFAGGGKTIFGDNPTATIYTNMEQYDTWAPDLAYSSGSGYFWAKSLAKGSYYTLVFESDVVVLERVIMESGDADHMSDQLISAQLESSPKLLKVSGNRVECDNFTPLGSFQHGRIDVSGLAARLNGVQTKCLRIVVTEDQKNWMILKQISIYSTAYKGTSKQS